MVSSELYLPEEDDDSASTMKEMIGGCCVCSDERGWAENPLVYCDGHGCNVAVHQACYGIVQVPTGPWFCRKCESQERAARVRCELCPHKDGALKRTDNGGWAHVVCALYIPEVEFANVSTMEPIVLQSVPHERYNKTCYICEEQGRESKAATGACMTCNKHGCRQAFHVTCAQFAGLLCEEQGSDADNVKYCGYCKYHYSKLKHKERDRHKPKHKKALELSPSLVPALMLSSEKSYNSSSGGSVSSISSAQKRLDDSGGRFTNANFQEVPSHSSSSSKDGGSSDGKSSEGKTKKSSSHGTGSSSGSRGRKSVPGKPHGPVVTTATSSTVPSSSSPFQQGLLLGSSTKSVSSGSVVQPTSDFLSFSDATLRTSESYTPSFGRSLLKSGSEGGASEGMVGLSTFSMLSQSSSSGKHYENCHPVGELGGLTAASYKRPQPSSSSSSATSSSSTGEDGVKKKKRGNWKNRYGPCYTSQDGKTTDTGEHGAALPSSTSPSPSSMSTLGGRGSAVSSTGCVGAGGAGSSSLGIQKSPSLLRNGSLQSMTVRSPPAGPGSYSSSSDVACPVPSAVLGGSLSGSNSDPVPTHQSVVTSMPTLTSLPTAAQFTSTSSTHSSLLPGSFNLAPSHMFGNRLNPNSAMAALIAQSESSPADQELGDGALGFSRRGNSPKANLSPRSPLSGLHIRYDSSGPLVSGHGSGTDSLPPAATSIDQLLERQWNEGQQFLLQQGSQEDVLGMLKSLHQLQVENRRLEEQIRTLTMKKERLQLLSAQLSVPFTPTSTTATTASSPLYPGNTHTDMLHSKNIQLGSSVLTDSSQPLPSQDPLSGGHSSGSSTSSLSTPPSAAHSPPQQQVNGVGMAGMGVQPGNANSSLPAIAGVTGLMGALQGNHLTMSGIVGALNGVIQSSPSLTQNTSSLTTHPSITSASLPNSLNNSSGTTVKTSAARILTEQHRQILLHQHQLQQIFSSQQPTHEQQQVLLYQLMQQQQKQQQQQNDVQLPINSLLPGTQPTISNNPFLAMHDGNTSKTGRLGDKAVSLTGQEKT
ncbi:protein AF-10 isoform X3 [Triplophysa dalaica]|uniref:protein AF-10 isoform X3 n=1 Tax=Triplophysa dalaica TaxID=1582913 RepID=UPI0024DFA991|nr:protein AF-10 isoform X3 [Triplophysa dalaica]